MTTRNDLQEVVTIMVWLKRWERNNIRKVGNIPRYLSARSVEENRTSVTREDRLGTQDDISQCRIEWRIFRYSLRCEGTRNFRSILLRQTWERRRKFTLSHRTPSPSITAATVLSAKMRPRYIRRIQRVWFAVEHVKNLTSGTPVKLTANNLYQRTKAESNRLNPYGNTAGSGTWGYWQLNSINCF